MLSGPVTPTQASFRGQRFGGTLPCDQRRIGTKHPGQRRPLRSHLQPPGVPHLKVLPASFSPRSCTPGVPREGVGKRLFWASELPTS